MVELNSLANAVVKLYDLVEQIGTVAINNTERIIHNSKVVNSLLEFTESVGTFVVENAQNIANMVKLLSGIATENSGRLDDLEITLYTLIDKVDLMQLQIFRLLGLNALTLLILAVTTTVLLQRKTCKCANKEVKNGYELD